MKERCRPNPLVRSLIPGLFGCLNRARFANVMGPAARAPEVNIKPRNRNFVKDEQYLWAKLERPEMTYFVSLYVAVDTFDHLTETVNRALALLEIVEIKPMETGMVTLNADSMRKGLAAEGTIAEDVPGDSRRFSPQKVFPNQT